MQQVILIGTIGKDLEQRTLSNGHKITIFDLVVNTKKKDELHATWFKVSFWYDHPLLKFLKKGSYICVGGDLNAPSIYEYKAEPRINLSVQGYSINFVTPPKKETSEPEKKALSKEYAQSKGEETYEDFPF